MNFALFFTTNTSLQLWKERGWLDGGVGIQSYNRWAPSFRNFYFLTYGDARDLQYGSYLQKNITVLPKKLRVPTLLYSLIMPFVYRRELADADIFFSAQMEGSWAAMIAKFLFRKKYILRCGYLWTSIDFGTGLGRVKKLVAYILEWCSYHAADFIILTSYQAKKRITKNYHINPDKIEVIVSTVDTALFHPMALEKKPRSVIFVGRLEKEKNLFALFDALKGTQISFTVVGEGSLAPQLRALAAKDNLAVEFLGNRPHHELPDLLNRHEVFILPSLSEGSPKALLEAMACGLTVIGTNVTGINEIVQHRDNGFLCDITPEAIRHAILEVMADGDGRKRMGIQARKYVLEHCDFNKKIDQELKIFRQVVSKGEGSSSRPLG